MNKRLSPERIAETKELLAGISPTPWHFNSYSRIFSGPLSQLYMQQERLLDDKLAAEKREATDDDFVGFPEIDVAYVPANHGDTATPQGAKDAQFIADAPERIAELLDHIDAVEAELAEQKTRTCKAEYYEGGAESAAVALAEVRGTLRRVLVEATLNHASECACWMCTGRRGLP